MAHKKKSRRTFGSIRERNGKFEASYKFGGKTYYGPHQFLDRTQATLWLNGEHQLVLEGRWTPNGVASPLNTTWTFGAYAKHHIEVQTSASGMHLRPSTKELYSGYLRRGLAPLCHLPLGDITSDVVAKWYKSVTANKRWTTASKHYKFLRSVMTRALAEGYIKGVNPCQVRGAQNACSNIKTVTPSMAEVGKIARSINPRFQHLVLIMANAGLRFGEAAALTRRDVQMSFVDGTIRVALNIERAMSRLKDNTVIIGPPKSSAGYRMVTLNSALTDAVAAQLASLDDESNDALVFPSSTGTFLRNDVLNKALKAAAKRAGLDTRGISPHALRRAGATELANKGANIAEVQEYLGDSSEKAALRYVQTTGRTASLIERMDTGHADD